MSESILFLVQAEVQFIPHGAGESRTTFETRLVYAGDIETAERKFKKHFEQQALTAKAHCSVHELKASYPIV